MGIAYRYLDDADVVVTVWDGQVTPTEWGDAIARQVASPAWLRGKRRITDARTADPSSITPDDVDEASVHYDRDDVNKVDARLAIVANEGWTVAQRVETAMRKLGVTTVVFNDVHTACAWRGVDASRVSVATSELRSELRKAKLTGDG